jgi:cyclophilin family peptidyl-prolyl cis-trans isomerase
MWILAKGASDLVGDAMTMRWIKIFLLWIGLATAAMAQAQTPVTAPPAPTPDNILHLALSTGGEVAIELRPDRAPGHVARVKQLTRAGFYDGLLFHRVIDGFMAQTGDPEGTGSGGSPLPDLKAEFNDLPHFRGAVSMARTDDPNSANSQFFIVFQPTLRLDGKYTVFGRVLSGMQYVDTIERGEPPASPSRIVKAWLGSDGRNAPRVTLVVPPPAPATPTAAAAVPDAPAPATTAEATPETKKGKKVKKDKKKSKG